MSLYNAVNGVNQAVFYALPMLWSKHPNEYPRFRNCFFGRMTRSTMFDQMGIPIMDLSEDDIITIFTRTGGGNRSVFALEIAELKSHPNFIEEHDDTFDKTFACFEYSIPDEWLEDYKLVRKGLLWETSEKYQEQVKKVYPKIADKLTEIFNITL